MRKLYYIYDEVADSFIYFCEAAADAVAIRAFKNACAGDFVHVAQDLSLFCLGELKDGNIVPDHVLIFKEAKDA